MSSMLENLANPLRKEQMEERMALMKEDPSIKHIFEEIETGGPAAMMRWEMLIDLTKIIVSVQSLSEELLLA